MQNCSAEWRSQPMGRTEELLIIHGEWGTVPRRAEAAPWSLPYYVLSAAKADNSSQKNFPTKNPGLAALGLEVGMASKLAFESGGKPPQSKVEKDHA